MIIGNKQARNKDRETENTAKNTCRDKICSHDREKKKEREKKEGTSKKRKTELRKKRIREKRERYIEREQAKKRQ